MVRKIISGGQTGADQGGLYAAEALGLEIGGTAPRCYRTESGPSIALLRDRFHLAEHQDYSYPPRTKCNVVDSNGTLLIGFMGSPGSRLTIKLCIENNKPYICNPTQVEFRAWALFNNIEVLNVAGNRESSQVGICERVKTFIIGALTS